MRARSALRAFFLFQRTANSNTRAVPQRYAAERQAGEESSSLRMHDGGSASLDGFEVDFEYAWDLFA
jgi:hypothetical protein